MVAGVSNVAQVIVDPKIGAVIGLKRWRRWAPGDYQNRRGLVGGLSEGELHYPGFMQFRSLHGMMLIRPR